MPGTMELVVIFAVALIIFGPKRMPEIGKSVGKAMREFRKAKTDLLGDLTTDIQEARDMALSNVETSRRKSEETK